MSGGLLDRPGDKPAPEEEAAVVRFKTRADKIVEDCDWRLVNSAGRSRRYKAIGAIKDNDLAIERRVQDRILDERLRARA